MIKCITFPGMGKSQARSAFTDFNFSTLNLEASLYRSVTSIPRSHNCVVQTSSKPHNLYRRWQTTNKLQHPNLEKKLQGHDIVLIPLAMGSISFCAGWKGIHSCHSCQLVCYCLVVVLVVRLVGLIFVVSNILYKHLVHFKNNMAYITMSNPEVSI